MKPKDAARRGRRKGGVTRTELASIATVFLIIGVAIGVGAGMRMAGPGVAAAPRLAMESPQGTLQVSENQSVVTLTGTTDGDRVEVNGAAAGLKGGRFTITVPVQMGVNTLTVRAYRGGAAATAAAVVIRGFDLSVFLRVDSPAPGDTFSDSQGAVDVRGVTSGERVEVNGLPVAVAGGNFTATVPLAPGANTMLVTAFHGTKANSVSMAVVRGPAPYLLVVSPSSGTQVNESLEKIVVNGTTSAESLRVNGAVVAVERGNFQATVPLLEGINNIRVEAVRGTAVSTVTVTVMRGTVYPLAVVDDWGRTVVLPHRPQKVVSLSPSTTELIYAAGAGPRTVALDNNSDYPPETMGVTTRIAGFGWLDYETIQSLGPDLVLASGIRTRPEVDKLASLGLRVVVLDPRTVAGVVSSIRQVGLLVNSIGTANAVAEDFAKRMENVTTAVGSLYRPTLHYEYDSWGGYWSFGPGSAGYEVLVMAGSRPITANVSSTGIGSVAYPQLTSEYIIAVNPDVIVYATAPWIDTSPARIRARPGWGNITAVRGNGIYGIDDNILSRPGPRLVVGLERMACLIHPPGNFSFC